MQCCNIIVLVGYNQSEYFYLLQKNVREKAMENVYTVSSTDHLEFERNVVGHSE